MEALWKNSSGIFLFAEANMRWALRVEEGLQDTVSFTTDCLVATKCQRQLLVAPVDVRRSKGEKEVAQAFFVYLFLGFIDFPCMNLFISKA